MRRRSVLALLAAGTALSGCGLIWKQPSETYRYRITLEIDTPQGMRSGSSVIEVTMRFTVAIPQSMLIKRVTGEAVAVDLPDGRTVYALLDQADRIVPLGFRSIAPLRKMRKDEDWLGPVFDQIRYIKTLRDTVTIPIVDDDPDHPWKTIHPMMVTFADPTNAESVVKLDPSKFGAVLGSGTKFRRITVQMTDAPVTNNIAPRLQILGIVRGQSLDQDFNPTTNPTLAQQLGYRYFRMEGEQP